MYEEKNKRKVHYDRIDPEVFSDLEKEYEKYKITPETIENAKRMATLFGDSYLVRLDKDTLLRALLGPTYEELKGIERIMLRPPCIDESSVEDLTKLSISIHHDGVDKNLRGMTVDHMYIDDFYYNLPEPPETDIVTVIQSVDYDKLKKMLDVRHHIHYLDSWGSRYLDLDELKEERNNDSLVGEIHYNDSVSDCISMLSARYNKADSARRCRKRHRK